MKLFALLALLTVALPAAGQAPAGCADLTWLPPTQNTDGSPYTNAAGYVAYTGPAPGLLNTMVPITNPGQLAVRICSLPAGLRYFAVTARNTLNVESVLSNLASKVIVGSTPGPGPPVVPQPVTIAGPIFNFGMTDNSLLRLEAGTVVAGRACDPTQQIAYSGTSYMRVNVSSVTPFPGQQVFTAWAVCQ